MTVADDYSTNYSEIWTERFFGFKYLMRNSSRRCQYAIGLTSYFSFIRLLFCVLLMNIVYSWIQQTECVLSCLILHELLWFHLSSNRRIKLKNMFMLYKIESKNGENYLSGRYCMCILHICIPIIVCNIMLHVKLSHLRLHRTLMSRRKT